MSQAFFDGWTEVKDYYVEIDIDTGLKPSAPWPPPPTDQQPPALAVPGAVAFCLGLLRLHQGGDLRPRLGQRAVHHIIPALRVLNVVRESCKRKPISGSNLRENSGHALATTSQSSGSLRARTFGLSPDATRARSSSGAGNSAEETTGVSPSPCTPCASL